MSRVRCPYGEDKALLPSMSGHGKGILPLRNGCLVIMGGDCQRTHKHEVMHKHEVTHRHEVMKFHMDIHPDILSLAYR